jgi:integrase
MATRRPSSFGASLAINDTDNPDEAAKRWVPWLCAYSGSRPGEVCQLRGVDIFLRDGIWAMRLTPAAGNIKNRRARTVPLHEHLLEQGFLEFVRTKRDGPLFYRPRQTEKEPRAKTAVKKSPAAQARQRLAKWVRSLGVSDKALSPNHGWRHTFKRIARRHRMDPDVSNYITGHSPRDVSASYGAPTLDDMADAMREFPRYALGSGTASKAA